MELLQSCTKPSIWYKDNLLLFEYFSSSQKKTWVHLNRCQKKFSFWWSYGNVCFGMYIYGHCVQIFVALYLEIGCERSVLYIFLKKIAAVYNILTEFDMIDNIFVLQQ